MTRMIRRSSEQSLIFMPTSFRRHSRYDSCGYPFRYLFRVPAGIERERYRQQSFIFKKWAGWPQWASQSYDYIYLCSKYILQGSCSSRDKTSNMECVFEQCDFSFVTFVTCNSYCILCTVLLDFICCFISDI